MPGRPAGGSPSHTGGVHRHGWTPTPRGPASASAHGLGAASPRPRPFRRSNRCSARSTLRPRSTRWPAWSADGPEGAQDAVRGRVRRAPGHTRASITPSACSPGCCPVSTEASVPLLNRPPLQLPTVRQAKRECENDPSDAWRFGRGLHSGRIRYVFFWMKL